MMTLRKWFNHFTQETGEVPVAIVLGVLTDEGYSATWPYGCDDTVRPVVAFRDVPAQALDREFSAGYGGNESPDLCAWSPSWVIFSDNYDGAESLRWVPRNPIAHTPIRPGGG